MDNSVSCSGQKHTPLFPLVTYVHSFPALWKIQSKHLQFERRRLNFIWFSSLTRSFLHVKKKKILSVCIYIYTNTQKSDQQSSRVTIPSGWYRAHSDTSCAHGALMALICSSSLVLNTGILKNKETRAPRVSIQFLLNEKGKNTGLKSQ